MASQNTEHTAFQHSLYHITIISAVILVSTLSLATILIQRWRKNRKSRNLSLEIPMRDLALHSPLHQTIMNPTYHSSNGFLALPSKNFVNHIGHPLSESKWIKKENIKIDVTEDTFGSKPAYKEIGRGHFATVYKGIFVILNKFRENGIQLAFH